MLKTCYGVKYIIYTKEAFSHLFLTESLFFKDIIELKYELDVSKAKGIWVDTFCL
jgi:hypothetical protein